MRPLKKSSVTFKQSQNYFPGGVNSPVRSFKSVGGNPPVISKGRGPYLFDIDGNRYLDYVGSWGPLILGHGHPAVVSAVRKMAGRGMTFGAVSPYELELAKLVRDAFPSMEKMRFVSSGTEATMSAIRLARGFTGRDYILKFEGCYHGHSDSLLVKAGSGALTFGTPSSPGVPADLAKYTLTATFNSPGSVERLFHTCGSRIAAVIVEPVPANMGVILPDPGFLAFLRDITRRYRSLLIFDEIITGFRLRFGGAQQVYKTTPDLTTLGKIIGGGMPVGAYGGRSDIMARISPDGPVYQAGTLSGNPLAMAAGIATLTCLKNRNVYRTLERRAKLLTAKLTAAAKQAGVPVCCNRIGSMFTVFFTDTRVVDYKTALKSDTHRYAAFFNAMLKAGIYLAPSQFEAAFVSLAHTDRIIRQTAAKASRIMLKLKNGVDN